MATFPFLETSTLSKLLKQADPSGQMKVFLSQNRLLLGADPFNPSCEIDFSAETIVLLGAAGAKPISEVDFGSHANAKYKITVKDQRVGVKSLKDVLKSGLILLEKASPGTLEKLSNIKPYSKRIVAKDRRQLFESKHLVDSFSEKLQGEWWIGTNNSTQEVRAWLERATQCAGLTWNKDFKVWF
ncbi:MAG: hypothetical protein JWN16_2612 [Alphaproteobacteria bacterium]|nr:hypothetical protein [Alphaproteobacteria bacterium]